MKKLIILFVFFALSASSFSQNPCQANFNYYLNPSEYIILYDSSNVGNDVVTSCYWLVTAPDQTIILTSTQQYPLIPINSTISYVYVCYTINTSLGCTSTYCDTVFFPNFQYCYPYFYLDSINYTNNELNFFGYVYTGGATYNNITYSWDFGDGSSGTGQNPSHTYSQPGYYVVCLTVETPTGCTDIYCEPITIIDSSCIITVDANITHVSSLGGNDGSIELTITGATPPYNIIWLNSGQNGSSLYNLSSGTYIVSISSANPACPSVTYTYYILEPYDSFFDIVDTLYTTVIDTCFGFVVDSFNIESIYISGNNQITVIWAFSGQGMNIPIYATYTYYYNGTQLVLLTINCNSGYKGLTTYKGYIYIDPNLTVNENESSSNLNIYPNPASDHLYIDFNSFLSDNTSLQIYSSTGQLVYNETLPANLKFIRIDIRYLTNGLYFIKLKSDSGTYKTGKFIK